MNTEGQIRSEKKTGGYSRREFTKLIIGGSVLSLYTLNQLNATVYQSITSLNQKYIKDESPDGIYWDAIMKHYIFQDGLIMMNNGTVGPMPKPVLNTLIKSFKIQATNPFDFYNYFPRKKAGVRAKLAKFINAAPEEVAMLRNTTEGMNFVANGLDLKEGDEVLISNLEHPGGIHPWRLKEKRFGIKIKEVPLGVPPANVDEIVSAFKKAITPKTKIISISHTVYITGLITPLKELSQMAHERDILVLADSAHGLGMLKLDMKELGIDFFCSSPYKWLGAPTGRGLLYVKKEAQDKLWPTIATYGWDKVKDARKFETLGQRADPLTFALGEAIDFQQLIGRDRIERRIKALASYLKQELQKIKGARLHVPMDLYLSGGLTAFSIEGIQPEKIVNYLREKYNIVIRTIGREKDNTAGVRISTHIFSSFLHVDMVLEGIKHLVKHRK
ncbi:MAG: aminotransferase class V-fold PLP-dependent enzyme [Candidatus Aminicenantes bacterium]|nr:aminotransferase class V-fold PLP-dependent enzyme [Candidatus Aminicenantes bacterium]